MKIENEWVILPNKYEGLNVRRKFAGLNATVDIDNNINKILISYYQQLYTDTDYVVKTELKTYTLNNLTESSIDGYLYEATNSLEYFYNDIGKNAIINPVNDTLNNAIILPVDIEDYYPLHRDTRNKTIIENIE